MLRIAAYAALTFVGLIALLLVVTMIGMAIFGIAIVRSYAFGLFFSAYVLLSIAAAIVAGLWLGGKRD